MIIKLYPENNALPIGPAVNRVGSALPLRIVGVPSGATAVAVSVFNADGAACNLDATLRGGEWVATVPASHFASWGKVARGLRVAVSFQDATEATHTVVFVGDMRIERTAAGDPEGTGKPKDTYHRSEIIDGVQHYKREVLTYSERQQAWGAEYEGDYVFVGGDFVPFSSEVEP